MANGTLSGYFEKKKTAKDISGQAVSPYSAPVEPAGGSMPSAGGSSSAPKSAPGGGTGFVSFGQYFGANAPAIQQQAQQSVGQASTTKAFRAPKGASGLAMERPERFGPMPSASTMLQRQAAGPSPSAQLAAIPGQMEGLKQAAESGYMGENVSAFDQLLGGGVTQRAAKQEQQRLGALRSTLEGQQAQYQQAQQQKADAERKAKEEKAYNDMMDLERRKAEYAASLPPTPDSESWWDTFMNNLSIGSSRG